MKIRIEQTLHGYYMGHGLLASSVPWLELEDASLMSTLSDWTGYRGSTEEDDNYLSVYPLPCGKYMAFAKTWYAKEMERPGCVWTHTLLVPVECFTGNFDIRNLLKFFRRPEVEQYVMYNEALIIDSEDIYNYGNDSVFCNIEKISFLFLFSVLLGGFKGAFFTIDRSQKELQLLLLSLLQYLPQDILFETSVSSGSEAIRRLNKNKFSLQFIMGQNTETLEGGNWRSELAEDNFTQGLRYLYDVACKKYDNTSYLIHLFDKDIEKSSLKFESVINLFKLLDEAVEGKKSEDSYDKVLSLIFGAFPKANEGKLVKANFLGKKITDYFCSDSECLIKVASQDLEEEDWKYVRVKQRLQFLDHSELFSLAISLVTHQVITETPKQILLYAFEHFDAAEVNTIVLNNWEQLEDLIIDNESYINKEYWLLLPKEYFNVFFQALPINAANNISHWDRLLDCVLANGTIIGDEWAMEIMNHESCGIKRILDFANQNGIEFIANSLLKVCISKVQDCLDWMNNQKEGVKDDSLLNLLTSGLDPLSDEVQSYPYLFWLGLLKCNSKDSSFLSFMFVLAFQRSGNDSIILLNKVFDDIYIAQSKNIFPNKDWNRIAFYTNEIKWVKEWDKCKRLCLFVIRFMHRSGYDKDVIKKISNNRSIRERLMKFWKKTYSSSF